jgi:hypothetical protein
MSTTIWLKISNHASDLCLFTLIKCINETNNTRFFKPFYGFFEKTPKCFSIPFVARSTRV